MHWTHKSYLLLTSASGGHAWPAVWQWDCCHSSTPCTSADETEKKKNSNSSNQGVCCPCWGAFPIWPRTHSEVEALSLLLIGSSLTDVCLAHVGVRGSRFDRLCGLAVLEGLGHIKVLHCEHVLKRLHGCIKGLPHLTHATDNTTLKLYSQL